MEKPDSDPRVICIDLAGCMLSQNILNHVHGLSQLQKTPFDIVIRNISSVGNFPRLLADYGQFDQALAVAGVLELSERMNALELAFRLRTNEIKS